MRKLPRSVTVCVDTREKTPLLFPPVLTAYKDISRRGKATNIVVKTKEIEMPEGDYCLDGFEGTCIVERKGSMRELHQNLLTKDRKRFLRALDRLAEKTKWPGLFLGFGWQGTTKGLTHVPEPGRVMDALWQTIASYPTLQVIGGWNARYDTSRRQMGGGLLRFMLGKVYQ